MKNIKQYILKNLSTNWNTIYKKFGVYAVNKEIEQLNIYSGMNGKPHVLK